MLLQPSIKVVGSNDGRRDVMSDMPGGRFPIARPRERGAAGPARGTDAMHASHLAHFKRVNEDTGV